MESHDQNNDTNLQEKPLSELEMANKRIKDLQKSYQDKATAYNATQKELKALQVELDVYKSSVNELNLFTQEEREALDALALAGDHVGYANKMLELKGNVQGRINERKAKALEQAEANLQVEKFNQDKATLERMMISLDEIPYGVMKKAEAGEIELVAWAEEYLLQQKKHGMAQQGQQQEPNFNDVGFASGGGTNGGGGGRDDLHGYSIDYLMSI